MDKSSAIQQAEQELARETKAALYSGNGLTAQVLARQAAAEWATILLALRGS